MKSSLDNLVDYTCIICQLIYTDPVKLNTCSHAFCRKCLNNAIQMQSSSSQNKSTFQCLICRSDFIKKDITTSTYFSDQLSNIDYQCDCKESMKLSEYNRHIEKCPFHLKEIEASIQQNLVKDVKKCVNRATFTCPVCKANNFERKGLIEHVETNHYNATGVCPICLSQPWGDPNYVTGLYGHLMKRHQFDYDEVVDYNNEEDEILAQVLKDSLYNQ